MSAQPERRRLRSASEDRDEEITPSIGGVGRMQELLANYYGMQRGADRSTHIDSTAFDSKAYVRGLLKNDRVETLLRKDDDMVREVKKLDSDMQMLVYENYNKFISATDTIRKMAQNVEGMESEMADLGQSMDKISESSATVNAALKDSRSRMHKLVRVRRLLQRLDFLFQLPQRLEEAVQAGEFAKAIRYFSTTKDILRKHSHVSSFAAIQRDCEDTVRRLQDKLQEEVNSPDVSRDTLVSHLDLLLRLGVDPSGLKERYIEAHGRQLHGFLTASRGALVDDYSISLDACLGKLAEGFLPMLLRTVQMYCQLFQRSGESASVVANAAEEDSKEVAKTPPKPASSPKKRQSEDETTGTPTRLEGKRRNADRRPFDGIADEGIVDDGRGVVEGGDEQAGLVALAKSTVDGFFALLKSKVDHSLDPPPVLKKDKDGSDVQEPFDGQASYGAGVGDAGVGEGGDLDAVALGGVVAAVQQLVSDMETVDPHVPQVFLAQRAKEFAQDFKRGQVRRLFRALCRSSLAVATSVGESLRRGVRPDDLLLDAPEVGSVGGGTWSGGAGSKSNSSSASRRRRNSGGAGPEAQYQMLIERTLETLLKGADNVVVGARPLSRLDASPRPLAEELRLGLWGVVLWLASAFGVVAGVMPDALAETLPSAEGKEYFAAIEDEWRARTLAYIGEPLPTLTLHGEGGARLMDRDEKVGSVSELSRDLEEGEEGLRMGLGTGTDGEVALLFACLCRGLGTTFVVRVSDILSRQLPPTLDQSVHAPPPHFSSSIHSTRSISTLHSGVTERSLDGEEDSGGTGGILERRRQVDAVRGRVSAAALSILEHYAETTGIKMADVLQIGLDAPPLGEDWFSVDEPTRVNDSIMDALEIAEDSVKEVCAFVGETKTGTVSVTRTGDRDLRRGASSSMSARGGGGSVFGGSGGGVRRDIDRIFDSGTGIGSRGLLSGSARVDFAADAMLAAVFRVALKAFGERARFLTLPGPGFRQINLDVDFLRQVLPYYVAESQMLASLDRLLDQAMLSAADRSLDPTAMDPSSSGDIVALALDSFK